MTLSHGPDTVQIVILSALFFSWYSGFVPFFICVWFQLKPNKSKKRRKEKKTRTRKKKQTKKKEG